MKKINSTHISIVALVLAIGAIVKCCICCADKKDQNIEALLTEKPEIVVNAMQSYERIQAEQQREAAKKALAASLSEIEGSDAGVIANPEGTIVLVEFYDFSCGYCKRIAPVLETVAKNNPNVKVIGRELTFLGPISQYAAKAVLAAKEQGKYADVYNALMKYEGQYSEAKIDELSVLAGINLEQLKADMNSDKVAQQLAKNNELAGKAQVRGVPTLILGGEVLQTLDPVVIQQKIDSLK